MGLTDVQNGKAGGGRDGIREGKIKPGCMAPGKATSAHR